MVHRNKIGHEYDSIRKDLLICHQGRAWQIFQYSITIQTAFIAAWYYTLFEVKLPILSFGALLFSSTVMYLLREALTRYNYLMGLASSSLNKGESIYFKNPETSTIGAGTLSVRIMNTILVSNIVMLGFTLGAWNSI